MVVRSKNAAKEAAVNEKKMIAGKQQTMRTAGRGSSYLTADQSRMLSYLSREELKRWDSYSPMRQRKIMEEVEKRLARRGKTALEDDWQAAGPGSYYIDNFSEEETDTMGDGRNNGSISGETDLRFLHEKRDAPIRTVEPAPIRSKEMVMRMGIPAASPSGTHKRGSKSPRGHPGRKMATAQEAQEKARSTGRKPESGTKAGSKGLNKRAALHSQEAQEVNRKQTSSGSILDNPDREDMPGRAGKHMVIRKSAERETGRKPEAAVSEDVFRTGGRYFRNGDDRTGHDQVQDWKGDTGYHAGTSEPSLAGQNVDTKQIRLAMHQRQLAEELRNGKAERAEREHAEAGYPASVSSDKNVPGQPVSVPEAVDAGKAGTAGSVTGKIPGEEAVRITGRGKADEALQAAGRQEIQLLGEKWVQAAFAAAGAETGNKNVIGAAAEQKKKAATALAQAESGRRRNLVTGRRRFEEQDVLKRVSGRQKRKASGSVMNGIRNRRESRKKEVSYRKAFVSELRRLISMDLRKSENIRQAQKTGQISATVSELTGQTMRSTVSTAALPVHAAMKVLTKRLREEFKKKLKEAVAALGRYAVSLGGPVLIILLIVLLLGGFLMAFISDQKENTGYGLGFQIVQEAMKHIGLPYVYGGTDLETGCDCSGFVWAIYNKFGYNLPRTAGDQYAYGRKISSNIDDWQLGDLIYYSRTGDVQSGGGRAEHIVIYAGNGQVISCGPVQVYSWDYRSDYYGTCRIIPDEPDGGDFSGSTNEEICWNYFISQGFSEAATAGILGNMYVESGGTFDPSIHQYGGGPGRGLCQWEESYSGGSGRYNQLVAFAGRLGLSWEDITVQLMFVTHEMNNGSLNPYFSKWGGVENFKHMTDPSEATYVFLCGFEYCGDPGQGFLESNFSLSTRVSHAQWAYTYYS